MNVYLEVILKALWFLLPSMVAGPGATFLGGGVPVDLGKKLSDGKRILGDGKTWRGVFGGIAFAAFFGMIQTLIVIYTDMGNDWLFGLGWKGWLTIIILGTGSILGDSIGSFIKRRLDKERGYNFPLLDQYDYVFGTFLLLLVFRYDFFISNYIIHPAWVGLMVVLIQTPLVHRLVNIIGYRIGVKKVPW